MPTILKTKEALDRFPGTDAFLIAVVDGKEVLIKASALADPMPASHAVEETALQGLEARIQSLEAALAKAESALSITRQQMVQLVQAPAVTAESLGVASLVGTQPAKALTDQGFVTTDLFRDHLRKERYVTRTTFETCDSVYLGKNAGLGQRTHTGLTLVGRGAGVVSTGSEEHATAIGADAQLHGSYSVQLGSTDDTVYMTKAPATRADQRDFFLKPLDLGLDYILSLTPQRGEMNLREDCLDPQGVPPPPYGDRTAPLGVFLPSTDPRYMEQYRAYQEDLKAWESRYGEVRSLLAWQKAYRDWLNQQIFSDTHLAANSQGEVLLLTADNVAFQAEARGTTFPGVTNAKDHDGHDILSIRLEEMIPVIVKAIQDLNLRFTDPSFVDTVAASVVQKLKP